MCQMELPGVLTSPKLTEEQHAVCAPADPTETAGWELSVH